MKGVYTLFLRLEEPATVKVGAMGELEFPAGIYAYAGSAMNSLESRLERHFSSPRKRHWHIDYLSSVAEPFDYLAVPEESSYECVLADVLSRIGEPVKGFGASDCGCESHLFRVEPEQF